MNYAILMLLAIGVGSWLLKRSQSDLALNGREKLALLIGAYCGAMIGAKLPFALSDWEGLRTGSVWFSDGKTILCGMVGAYFGVELTKWIYHIKTKTGDSFAVPAAVSVAIGRLSCFVAGCCFGTPTQLPWGVRFPLADQGAVARHPTQLYEVAFHALMALILARLRSKRVWQGQLIKFYILCYLGYRLLSEFIREEPVLVYGMTAYQWFAIVMAPVFGGLWWRDARKGNGHGRPRPHPERTMSAGL